MQFNVYESGNFSDSSLDYIFESTNFRFPFVFENGIGSEM